MATNIDSALDLFDKNESMVVQNSIPIKDPGFTKSPVWYMNGNEKSVKIGNKSFNYIDYLEAFVKMDCNTHRSDWVLMTIEKTICEAMDEVGYKY